MKFGQVFQEEVSFKDISYLELWQPFFQWTETICAILGEGIMRNNPVYFEFGPVVLEEMAFKGISYLELWQPFCSAECNHLPILV